MKSRITIEVDFENGNMPVIQILARKSDDVRDNLVSAFLQSLQHSSRWCKILYNGNFGVWDSSTDQTRHEVHKWTISPMTPSELPEEMKLMEGVFDRWKNLPVTNNP